MSGRVLAIHGGKGGIGRTTLTWALGAHLARQGEDVVLIDLGRGMRGLDIAMGLESRIGFDLDDVLSGRCGLDRALAREKRTGVTLLAAKQVRADGDRHARSMQILLEVLRAQRDWVLMDTPAAFAPGFDTGAALADEAILLTTPDDAALRGADSVIAALRQLRRPAPHLVVTRLRADLMAEGLQYTPEVCAQVLDVPLGGVVPESERWMRAALAHQPLPVDSPGAAAVAALAERLRHPDVPLRWRDTLRSVAPGAWDTACLPQDAGGQGVGIADGSGVVPGVMADAAQAAPEAVRKQDVPEATGPDGGQMAPGLSSLEGTPRAGVALQGEAGEMEPTEPAGAAQATPLRRRTFRQWLFGK